MSILPECALSKTVIYLLNQTWSDFFPSARLTQYSLNFRPSFTQIHSVRHSMISQFPKSSTITSLVNSTHPPLKDTMLNLHVCACSVLRALVTTPIILKAHIDRNRDMKQTESSTNILYSFKSYVLKLRRS